MTVSATADSPAVAADFTLSNNAVLNFNAEHDDGQQPAW